VRGAVLALVVRQENTNLSVLLPSLKLRGLVVCVRDDGPSPASSTLRSCGYLLSDLAVGRRPSDRSGIHSLRSRKGVMDSEGVSQRDRYCIAEQPAPAPHLVHLEGCAALRIVLVTVPRVSRSCEHFSDGFFALGSVLSDLAEE
jgi:hypothetical protein